MPLTYGYARVSTDGQTLDAQVAQLEAAGASKLFKEKVSGAKRDRVQLDKMLGTLNAGDVVIVTRLDRLARSTRDLSTSLASSPTRAQPSDRSETDGQTRRPLMVD